MFYQIAREPPLSVCHIPFPTPTPDFPTEKNVSFLFSQSVSALPVTVEREEVTDKDSGAGDISRTEATDTPAASAGVDERRRDWQMRRRHLRQLRQVRSSGEVYYYI